MRTCKGNSPPVEANGQRLQPQSSVESLVSQAWLRQRRGSTPGLLRQASEAFLRRRLVRRIQTLAGHGAAVLASLA
jgi:hypothetical protein